MPVFRSRRFESDSSPRSSARGALAELVRPSPDDVERCYRATVARLFGPDPHPPGSSRYRLDALIGSGGMGVVYRAWDRQLERPVAVKKLFAVDSSAAVDWAEGRGMAKVRHPNVVSVYDVVELEGRTAVVMELVDGSTLREWLDAKPRSEAEILDVIVGVARGLAAVHAAGWVHRDVKPSNILIGRDGRAQLGDFGLAQPTEEPDQDMSPSRGAGAGTRRYMSPEQTRGGPITAASDQYTLCCVAWEALSGRMPSAAARSGSPAWARVRAVLERGLGLDPADRWPSTDALVDALESTRDADERTGRARAWLAVGLGGAVAAAVVLGGLGLRELGGPTQDEPCETIGRAIDATWSADRPAPADRRERALADLDAHVGAWRDRSLAACRSVEPEARPDVVRCLERRRTRLEGLVLALRTIDPDAMMAAVSGLEPPEGCVDDPVRSGTIDVRMEAVAAAADVLVRRGQPHDAIAVLGPAHAQEEVGRAPSLSHLRAAIVLGRAKASLGDTRTAAQLLEQAWSDAMASGDEELTVAAGTHLAHALAPADLAGAQRVIASVTPVANRARVSSAALSRFHAVRGHLMFAAGRDDAAAAAYESALANAEPIDVQRLRVDIGTARAARGDAEGALAIQRDAYERLRAELGEDAPATSHAARSLAITLLRFDRHDEAEALLRRALAAVEARLGPNSREAALTVYALAATLAELGRPDEARVFARRTLTSLQASHRSASRPEELADVWSLLGTIERRAGHLDRAIAHYREALERVATLDDDQGSPAEMVIRFNLGEAMVEQSRPAEALEHLRRAARIAAATMDEEHPDRVMYDIALGRTLLAAGHHRAGLDRLERACAMLEAMRGTRAEQVEHRFALGQALLSSGEPSVVRRGRSLLDDAAALARAAEADTSSTAIERPLGR